MDGRQYPIKFGVEEEVFLIELNGNLDGTEQKKFLKHFAQVFGHRVVQVDQKDGLPLQVNKDCPQGYSAIKFDSTFNTLEIAYPPFIILEEFQEFSEMLWSALLVSSQNFELNFKRVGYLNLPVNEEHFFLKESVQKTISRPHSGRALFDPYYHAKICASQIHLDLDNDHTHKNLNKYYFFEPLIPLLFTNSDLGHGHRCMRLQVLQDSFSPNYHFFGFPVSITKSKEEYLKKLTSNPDCWRDYSLITPRSHGSWEFRSACIQPKLENLINLIKFRLAVAKIVQNTDDKFFQHFSVEELLRFYTDACQSKDNSSIENYLAYIVESQASSLLSIKPDIHSHPYLPNQLKKGVA